MCVADVVGCMLSCEHEGVVYQTTVTTRDIRAAARELLLVQGPRACAPKPTTEVKPHYVVRSTDAAHVHPLPMFVSKRGKSPHILNASSPVNPAANYSSDVTV